MLLTADTYTRIGFVPEANEAGMYSVSAANLFGENKAGAEKAKIAWTDLRMTREHAGSKSEVFPPLTAQ
jgi:hypothetical protein